MALDMNNDYSAAGKGRVARERLTRASIPHKIDGGRKRRPKPYQARKPENAQEEPIKVTTKGLKAKIQHFSLLSRISSPDCPDLSGALWRIRRASVMAPSMSSPTYELLRSLPRRASALLAP
jgi:hypothetical protein